MINIVGVYNFITNFIVHNSHSIFVYIIIDIHLIYLYYHTDSFYYFFLYQIYNR